MLENISQESSKTTVKSFENNFEGSRQQVAGVPTSKLQKMQRCRRENLVSTKGHLSVVKPARIQAIHFHKWNCACACAGKLQQK